MVVILSLRTPMSGLAKVVGRARLFVRIVHFLASNHAVLVLTKKMLSLKSADKDLKQNVRESNAICVMKSRKSEITVQIDAEFLIVLENDNHSVE